MCALNIDDVLIKNDKKSLQMFLHLVEPELTKIAFESILYGQPKDSHSKGQAFTHATDNVHPNVI